MTIPHVVTEIDRLKDALGFSQARHVELTHEVEDMRAERNNAHECLVQHARTAADTAKELQMAMAEIDSLRNQLADVEESLAAAMERPRHSEPDFIGREG